MSLSDGFFSSQAIGHRDRWDEHRNQRILCSGDMIYSSYCLIIPVEHPDFLVRPVVALRNPILWPKLMRSVLF